MKTFRLTQALLALALVPLAFTTMTGCASPSSAEGVDEGEVVGITDLAPLETALKLIKDRKVGGAWSRSDQLLHDGTCYWTLKGAGAKEASNFEFRRYTNGAAFFRKLNAGPNSGDRRAIECVDLEFGEGESVSLSGLALDAVLRYDLGAPTSTDAGGGTLAILFERGEIVTAGPGKAGEPPIPQVEDTIDHPALFGDEIYSIQTPVAESSPGEEGYIGTNEAYLAYRYAYARGAAAGMHDLATDPVGKLLAVEEFPEVDDVVSRYEHLDIHRIRTASNERLFLTPKESDGRVQTAAIVTCTRAVDAKGVAAAFSCKGLD